MRRRSSPRSTRREPSGAGISRAERRRRGRALRQRLRRSEQADWHPTTDRPDPIELLQNGDRGKAADLLPIRYARMAASPFGFLRGAAGIMASDLAGFPTTGLRVQMLGDAHAGNFGLFATPEREQVFDANDFDETIPGPWEWDLKRLVTSLILAGRGSGLSRRASRSAARTAARSYRERMGEIGAMRYLDGWYSHLDLTEASREVGDEGLDLLHQELPRARHRTGFHAFPRLVRRTGARSRIRDAPPLLRHYASSGDAAAIREAFRRYRSGLPPERRALLDRYELVDVARKVVGIGSVGTRCAVGLFLADPDVLDPLFLQVKEARASVHEPFVGRSPFANHAERVVVGQRLVQQASDIFLSWSRGGRYDFYVRQLRDMKLGSDLTSVGPRSLTGLAELCGTALARAHARTGDPAAISGYLGSGPAADEAFCRFGERYAQQTEEDHAALRRAIRRGRLATAEPRVAGRR